MKKLGIIGGAGPLASALFYETLIYESYQAKFSLPEILLLNFPFNRGLTPEEKQENGFLIQRELLYCLSTLKAGGAGVAILICNTLHLELEKIPKCCMRFFSIPDLVLQEIEKRQSKRLLLLATQNTCNSTLYQSRGITIYRPSLEKQRIVDGVIDHILEGKILKEDAIALEEVIKSFERKIDGVILGCTDLPVLHHHYPISSDKPIYDSVKIPAKSILEYL